MQKNILVTRSSMPEFEEYMEQIRPLWESHWLTNMGTFHKQLEKALKDYLEVPQLSLIVNGHMALELAIQAMEFPEGAEVITTPFTFISTTHAIIRNRLKPVFCDVKLSDYTIDESKIEELITEKTVAILPVHVYGNICNVEDIQKIADKYNLKVIYDAAHAFGEKCKGVGVGNFGDASAFSFHATKVFNTIEGGAVAFREKSLYEKLYNLKNFGIRSEEVVAEVGMNAKMNEFCAGMGLCNLKYVEKNINLRKQRISYYMDKMKEIPWIRFCERDTKQNVYSYGYFPILFDSQAFGLEIRDIVCNKLRAQDIYPRKYFYPITADAACFKNKYRKLPLKNARYISSNILVLPLYPELEYEIIDRIVDIIQDTMDSKR
ncbi:MAG: DegT/DnrJ/EryC1/StrS family aminotransferase [Lachnospiraceae bacterium]|nr:DegT/DnrJ/EryC1/StrS family aminotransferase [Lachnospiraceae bacterium]